MKLKHIKTRTEHLDLNPKSTNRFVTRYFAREGYDLEQRANGDVMVSRKDNLAASIVVPREELTEWAEPDAPNEEKDRDRVRPRLAG